MAKLSTRVLKVLLGRKGFDDWWEDIYPEVQRDIKRELDALASPDPKTERQG